MKENINDWTEKKFDADERQLDFVKLTQAGQEIVGKLLRTFQSKNYGTTNYVFEVGKENLIAIGGCTVLDRKLADVQPGTDVKVIYEGKKLNEGTGREYHDYTVFTR